MPVSTAWLVYPGVHLGVVSALCWQGVRAFRPPAPTPVKCRRCSHPFTFSHSPCTTFQSLTRVVLLATACCYCLLLLLLADCPLLLETGQSHALVSGVLCGLVVNHSVKNVYRYTSQHRCGDNAEASRHAWQHYHQAPTTLCRMSSVDNNKKQGATNHGYYR